MDYVRWNNLNQLSCGMETVQGSSPLRRFQQPPIRNAKIDVKKLIPWHLCVSKNHSGSLIVQGNHKTIIMYNNPQWKSHIFNLFTGVRGLQEFDFLIFFVLPKYFSQVTWLLQSSLWHTLVLRCKGKGDIFVQLLFYSWVQCSALAKRPNAGYMHWISQNLSEFHSSKGKLNFCSSLNLFHYFFLMFCTLLLWRTLLKEMSTDYT